MKSSPITFIFCVLLLLPVLGRAQVVSSVSVERQKWLMQSSTNPIPLAYQFQSKAMGIGLSSAFIFSPASTNEMKGNSLQLTYTTNFPVLTLESTNVVLGLNQLNASFPTGDYQMRVVTVRTNPINQNLTFATNHYSLVLTNDFPTNNPVITNISAFSHLQATQTLAWPVFTTNTAVSNYVSCKIYEGDFDTNTLVQIAGGDADALTNFTWLNPLNFKFSPTQNSLTLTNIDTYLDHLVLLEFHAGNTNTATPLPVSEAASVASNLILYRAQPPPASLSIRLSSPNVILNWSTNSGPTYRPYVSVNLSSWIPLISSIAMNGQGEYEVVQPADESQRFFQLKAE